MNSLLLVIDLQESFINDNTNFLLDMISNLIDSKKYDKVCFTKFVNSFDSIWYTKLKYDGCISEKSRQILIEETKIALS